MKRRTTTVVESDIKALGHYGLTMALLIDHDHGEFTMTTVGSLTLFYRVVII